MVAEKSLDGKTALVTGASAGIGSESAKKLAEDGANVVLAARREQRLNELASTIESEHDVDALVVETDVTDEAAVQALVTETVETFGGLDVVVANAGTGTGPETTVEDLPTEQYRTVMAVNTDGMFYTARAAIPHLRESSGVLVFIGSFAGCFPRPGSPVYAATKWWTRGFALSLAGQVGNEDVGISVINPSEVRTEFGKEFREESFEDRYEPGEVTEPSEIADAVRYAARQEPPNTVSELDLYRRDKFSGF